MKLRDIMTKQVVTVDRNETVAVAARLLSRSNVGALPVVDSSGLCGVVTDRDLLLRCVAADRDPAKTRVSEVMTRQLVEAKPDMDTGAAAHLMGRKQIRRLMVVENGKLCGVVSLGDLANREETWPDAADALGDISSNISSR